MSAEAITTRPRSYSDPTHYTEPMALIKDKLGYGVTPRFSKGLSWVRERMAARVALSRTPQQETTFSSTVSAAAQHVSTMTHSVSSPASLSSLESGASRREFTTIESSLSAGQSGSSQKQESIEEETVRLNKDLLFSKTCSALMQKLTRVKERPGKEVWYAFCPNRSTCKKEIMGCEKAHCVEDFVIRQLMLNRGIKKVTCSEGTIKIVRDYAGKFSHLEFYPFQMARATQLSLSRSQPVRQLQQPVSTMTHSVSSSSLVFNPLYKRITCIEPSDSSQKSSSQATKAPLSIDDEVRDLNRTREGEAAFKETCNNIITEERGHIITVDGWRLPVRRLRMKRKMDLAPEGRELCEKRSTCGQEQADCFKAHSIKTLIIRYLTYDPLAEYVLCLRGKIVIVRDSYGLVSGFVLKPSRSARRLEWLEQRKPARQLNKEFKSRV